jgi:hypothetical protein
MLECVVDFERFGDDILQNRRMDDATIKRWHGFVAGEPVLDESDERMWPR